jgi:hypothetical protein
LIIKVYLIFRKRFTVFKTVNYFSKLNSSSLHARLISDCWNLAIVSRRNPAGHWNLAGARIQRNSTIVVGCRRARFQLKLARIWPKWSDSDRIWPKRPRSGQTYLPESGNGDRTLPDFGSSCIFAFPKFFVRAERWNFFLRKSFFLKMISSKIFYDGNHFTSKQTKHK